MKPLTTRSFGDLMAYRELRTHANLETTASALSERYFRSGTIPYQGKLATGVFGGHVLAQSAWVAAATVPNKDFICHNLTGYFLRPGIKDVPFYYHITVSRDGRSYSTREIKVYQPTGKNIDKFNQKYDNLSDTKGAKLIELVEDNPELWGDMLSLAFVGICSFKRPHLLTAKEIERKSPARGHQAKYRGMEYLNASPDKGKRPEDLPKMPDSDTPEWRENVSAMIENGEYEPPVHPIELHKLNLEKFNASIEEPTDRRVVHYFRSSEPLKTSDDESITSPAHYSTDDINLQVTALIYTSDRNSMYTVVNAQPYDNKEFKLGRLASISHNFVLHNLTKLPLVDSEHWSMMESWTDASGDGRGLYNGRIYDKDGVMTCSFMQDGVMEFSMQNSKL